MRALVISDTHFGAWTGEPLLQHQWARHRIGDALDDVDELVLLGDLFDFLFSSVENAFAQADGFFSLLAEKMAGKRIVFSCGNHDHHIIVRELRTAVELKVIAGNEAALADALGPQRNFFQRFLDRRLPGVECVTAYPTYQLGDPLCCHGHYLDAHVSLPGFDGDGIARIPTSGRRFGLMARRSKYPQELMDRAVRMALESGRPVAQVARDLGIGAEALRKRVWQAEADGGLRPDLPSSEEREEICKLRKEVFELRRANEILKAASVFFATELDADRPK